MRTKQNSNNSSGSFSGQLPFRMTNDYLFKILMQSDEEILRGIVCSFLDLDEKDIKSITVTNKISTKKLINSKEMILDVRAEMNNDTVINLEMQVLNHNDWPERSLSYLCRCFDNLQKGDNYLNVKSAVHIGFLDYTLFPENPEFYSTYRLINEKTGQLYSSKFSLAVVDLTQINLATQDDKIHYRNLWAAFFKAENWEELYMLADQNKYIKKAAKTVEELSDDEMFRMQCEAREDHLKQELDMKFYYEQKIANMKTTIADKDAEIASLKAQLASKSSNE